MAEITDGDYTVELTLSGGSGKASIKSPASIHIENGEITAEIIWSSSNYDYMEIGGAEYYPVNSDGNSTFIVKIEGFDKEIPFRAETLAMSQPHMVDYTMELYSDTLKKDGFPLTAVVIVICAAAAAAAAVIALAAKKRKKSHEADS